MVFGSSLLNVIMKIHKLRTGRGTILRTTPCAMLALNVPVILHTIYTFLHLRIHSCLKPISEAELIFKGENSQRTLSNVIFADFLLQASSPTTCFVLQICAIVLSKAVTLVSRSWSMDTFPIKINVFSVQCSLYLSMVIYQ